MVLFFVTVVGVTCDPGWINYKNLTCVFFAPFTDAGSWEASKRYCDDTGNGGSLITIRDAVFQVFVAGNITKSITSPFN